MASTMLLTSLRGAARPSRLCGGIAGATTPILWTVSTPTAAVVGTALAASLRAAFSCARPRPASTSSSAYARRAVQRPTSTTAHGSTTTAAAAAVANPPATTRPPPLELPENTPDVSRFNYLLATGKAYLAFYKTGLRYVVQNTLHVAALNEAAASRTASATPSTSSTPMPAPSYSTYIWTVAAAWAPFAAAHTTALGAAAHAAAPRADRLLRRRWEHDMRRLPLFGVLLVVLGELTPFFMLLFPQIVPITCRTPKQVRILREAHERRRRAALTAASTVNTPSPQASPLSPSSLLLVARCLGLRPMCDRVGLLTAAPALLAAPVVRRTLCELAEDDALLRRAGGADVLVPDEVVLACEDRGLDVVDVDNAVLRRRLDAWLALSKPADTATDAEADVYARITFLLTRRPAAWPALGQGSKSL